MAKLSNTKIFGWLQVISGYITGRLLAVTETEFTITEASTMDVDFNNGNSQSVVLTGATTPVTFNLVNFPLSASGETGSLSLEMKFTGTKPTINAFTAESVALTPINGQPDLSAASDTTGYALLEIYRTNNGYWLMVAGTV